MSSDGVRRSSLSLARANRLLGICVLLAAWLWAVPVAAQITESTQIPENLPPDSPIRLGPVRLSPTFELRDIGIDGNVFNDNTEERDFTATPSAGLVGIMLFGPMRLTGVMDSAYIWYQTFRSERSISNNINLRFEGFFDRLRPWVSGEFVRTRERQGFEIDARAQRTQPTIRAGVDWVLGSRTALALSTRLERTTYADFEQFQGANLSRQLDSESRNYAAGVRFDLTPLTMLLVDGEYGTARFTYEPVRDNSAWSVMPRLRFQPDAFISGELMVGYKTLTPKSPVLDRFAGFVAQGSLTLSLLDVTEFTIELERDTEYSFEELHPYYVQTGGRLTITQQIGGPFDVQVSGGRYELAFRDLPDPMSGPRGDEQLTTGGLGVGYRIGETIRIGVTGELHKRRSIFRPIRDYDRVGPQDVLRISVFNEPDLSGVFTVDGDGTVTFPFISRVSVDGLTLHEVETEITQQLGDGFLVNPQVSVEIEEYRSQSVYVLGEVGSPGIYRLSGNLSLIEVLVQAGGTTAQAGNELQIIRSASGRAPGGPVLAQEDDPEVEVTEVSLEDIRTGRLALVSLRDGDTVNVPKAAIFYVTGFVSSPGSYVWSPGMTVQRAIALAGGYTNRGSSRGIETTRMVDGVSTSVSVSEDDPVQPDDVINIRARRF